jgi:hypothetical protein
MDGNEERDDLQLFHQMLGRIGDKWNVCRSVRPKELLCLAAPPRGHPGLEAIGSLPLAIGWGLAEFIDQRACGL